VIVPHDGVKTGVSSQAELFFNDKSLIRVDQSGVFRFEPGVRRFKLKNRIAMNKVIFKLENEWYGFDFESSRKCGNKSGNTPK
jgi:hypothetical protein